jgi:hypothetical protein
MEVGSRGGRDQGEAAQGKGGVRMRTRFVTGLMVFAILWGGFPAIGSPFDMEMNRESLRGIKGVFVIVEELHGDVIVHGLSREMIRKDVELRLRQSGITVQSEEEAWDPQGSPTLYVYVNFYKIKDSHSYSFSVSVDLYQWVTINRTAKSTIACTWSHGMVGYVGESKINTTHEQIKQILDKFIGAYLSVNPKN